MGPIALIVIAVIVVILVLCVVGIYNALVRRRNEVKNAWSQVDVQLKRRYDLIPNLVETCKGYMKHEREVLENVTKARTQCINAGTVGEQTKAENFLTQTLKSLFAVAENYPDLKANQNMLALQAELSTTENNISSARQYYNNSVLILNNKVQMFPSNIIAGMFGFKQEEFFEIAEPEARGPVKVEF